MTAQLRNRALARTGWIPFAETGVDRDADLLKAFPIGSEVEVVVLEADASGRRIRLSRKAVVGRLAVVLGSGS